MIKPIALFCAALLLGSPSLAGPVLAQDAALYDNAIDPAKAYVRLLVQDDEQANIGGSPVALEQHVSGYVSVVPGQVGLGSGEHAASMSVQAGTYYTFVQTSDGFAQFVDKTLQDPSKAEIVLYNLTEEASVDLFVPAAKTNALSAVAAGTSQSVELRAPLSLAFEAQANGTTIASIAAVDLERKQAISLFLTRGANGVELAQVLNSFANAE